MNNHLTALKQVLIIWDRHLWQS